MSCPSNGNNESIMTLSEAIEDYMTDCYALSKRTREIYHEHLERLLNYVGDLSLDELDRRHLTQFMASLVRQDGKEYSWSYLDQIWRTLHTFFEYCVKVYLMPANPIRAVRKPKKVSGPKPRLSLEQIESLIEATAETALPRRNLAIILLMVDSGLRLNEVTRLRITDIDLQNRTAFVYSVKTHQTRNVPLHPLTSEILAKYQARYRASAAGDESFFLNRDGSPITGTAIHQFIKRLGKKLKISLHAHLLRHSFANNYIRCGKMERLQKILGHSDVSTTIRFYTDSELEAIKQEHESASPLSQIGRQREDESAKEEAPDEDEEARSQD